MDALDAMTDDSLDDILSNFDSLNISDAVIPATPQKVHPRGQPTKSKPKPEPHHNFVISSFRHVHNEPDNRKESANSGSIYKYYYLKSILNCPDCYVPLNSSIKLVGVHRQKDAKEHYLIEHVVEGDYNPVVKIVICFNQNACVPKLGDTVEVFGYLSLYANGVALERPVFVVDFWRSLRGNVDRYVACLSKLQDFFPAG